MFCIIIHVLTKLYKKLVKIISLVDSSATKICNQLVGIECVIITVGIIILH